MKVTYLSQLAIAALLALVVEGRDLEERRRLRAERLERHVPAHHIDKLQMLLGTWQVQPEIPDPTPSWAPEVPQAEQDALRAALSERYVLNSVIARKLLEQARLLKANPETAESADRIFVLAGVKGDVDVEELSRISQMSHDAGLKERARKLSIVGRAIGQPYSQLDALNVPLPDLAEFAGKPVLIVFWAASDTTFLNLWPQTRVETQKLANAGVQIVGINVDPPEQEQWTIQFIEKEEIQWPSLYRYDNPFGYSTDYCVRSLPGFWLIDEKGILLATEFSISRLSEVTTVLNQSKK